jgi:UDP-N-acetylmuramoylalanine--D-glutamate ligase
VVLFSRLRLIEDGIYCDPESGDLILCDPILNRKIQILNRKEIFIPGSHNLENAMAAAAIAYYAGIQVTVIAEVLRSFKGVEHRIEFVDDIRGVLYYNDSKGTNPDASIKAVEAMVRPTILIAGGMDKGSTFDELIEAFDGHVVKMIVFGETAELLLKTAEKSGFNDVVRVHTLDEAVKLAGESAAEGWSVLLSPACASWDMYDNFEQRGEHFKRCVRDLR